MPEEGAERPILGEILARLDGLNDLVRDLLLFSRPRAARLVPLRLRTLVLETVRHLTRDPELSRLEVTVTGDDPWVLGDTELLSGAVLNLLLNGAQAMGRKGQLRVSIAVAGGHVELLIADSGPGIPRDILAKVFEPFFTTKHRGTGLGLAVVRRVLDAHGGRIDLQCPPEGGTVAVAQLTLAAPPAG